MAEKIEIVAIKKLKLKDSLESTDVIALERANGVKPEMLADYLGTKGVMKDMMLITLPDGTSFYRIEYNDGTIKDLPPLSVADINAPVITLVGDNPMTIEHGDAYIEPGATALDVEDGAVSVGITGSVNHLVVGTNTITYTATDSSNNTSVVTRIVNVADTVAPVITLNGDNPMTIELGSVYIEPGAGAVDNVDGVITVNSSGSVDHNLIDTYTINYTATDAAGNAANAVRVVNVVMLADTTAPVITILGNNPLTIGQGDTYTEPGATAVDNVDGSVTPVITGSVDTATLGVYAITYTATDAAGNVAIATRAVNVEDTAVGTVTASAVTAHGGQPFVVEFTLSKPGTLNDPGLVIAGNATQTYLSTVGNVISFTITPIDPALPVTTIIALSDAFRDLYATSFQESNILNVPVSSGDTTAPAITLLGANPMYIGRDDTYTEPGATAVDAVDGAVTAVITGAVNNSVLGSNTITYTATDAAGNVAIAIRAVNVEYRPLSSALSLPLLVQDQNTQRPVFPVVYTPPAGVSVTDSDGAIVEIRGSTSLGDNGLIGTGILSNGQVIITSDYDLPDGNYYPSEGDYSLAAFIKSPSGFEIPGGSGEIVLRIDTVSGTVTASTAVTSHEGQPFDVIFTLSENGSVEDSTLVTAGNATAVYKSASGWTRTYTFTPTDPALPVTDITAGAGTFADAAGNLMGASTPFSVTSSTDTTAPAIAVSTTATEHGGAPFIAEFTANESISVADMSLITVTGSYSAVWLEDITNGVRLTISPTTYGLTGDVIVTAGAGAFKDAAENLSLASNSITIPFSTDTVAPTITATASVIEHGGTAFTVDFVAPEPILVENSALVTATGGTIAFSANITNGKRYAVTPVDGATDMVISAAAGAFTDVAGNLSLAAGDISVVAVAIIPKINTLLNTGSMFGETLQQTIHTDGSGAETVTVDGLPGATVTNNNDGTHTLAWVPPATDQVDVINPVEYAPIISVNGNIQNTYESDIGVGVQELPQTALIKVFPSNMPESFLATQTALIDSDFGTTASINEDANPTVYHSGEVVLMPGAAGTLTADGTDPEGNPANILTTTSKWSVANLDTNGIVTGDFVDVSFVFHADAALSDGFDIRWESDAGLAGSPLDFKGLLAGVPRAFTNEVRSDDDSGLWVRGDNNNSAYDSLPYYNPPISLGGGWWKWSNQLDTSKFGLANLDNLRLRFVDILANGAGVRSVRLGGVTVTLSPFNSLLKEYHLTAKFNWGLGEASVENLSRVDANDRTAAMSFDANSLIIDPVVDPAVPYDPAINAGVYAHAYKTGLLRARREMIIGNGNLHYFEGSFELSTSFMQWFGFWIRADGHITPADGAGEYDFLEQLNTINGVDQSTIAWTSEHGRALDGTAYSGGRKNPDGSYDDTWTHYVPSDELIRSKWDTGGLVSPGTVTVQAVVGDEYSRVWINRVPGIIRKTENALRSFQLIVDDRLGGQWIGANPPTDAGILPAPIKIHYIKYWEVDPTTAPTAPTANATDNGDGTITVNYAGLTPGTPATIEAE